MVSNFVMLFIGGLIGSTAIALCNATKYSEPVEVNGERTYTFPAKIDDTLYIIEKHEGKSVIVECVIDDMSITGFKTTNGVWYSWECSPIYFSYEDANKSLN